MPEIEEEAIFLSESEKEGMIKLGEQLKNPYSVENMKKAWDNLQDKNGASQGRTEEDLEIVATHLYLKFTPETEEELDLLISDSTVDYYDFPLDYEIEPGGSFYHDPEVPINQPTPQYCAVRVEKELPSVAYEILEELYIPEEIEESANGRSVNRGLMDALVDEALLITDNLEEGEILSDSTGGARVMELFPSYWTAYGKIEVFDHAVEVTRTVRVLDHYEFYPCEDEHDDDFGDEEGEEEMCRYPVYKYVPKTTGSFVPVHDVRVRTRRWFTTYAGYTDQNGNYTVSGRFRRPANFLIKWEKYHFSIRDGNVHQAKLNGPKKKGEWSVKIGNKNSTVVDSKQQYFALIFQAARDYYYGNRFGLSTPPTNSAYRPQMKLAAKLGTGFLNGNDDSHAAQYARTLGALPTAYIREFRKSADGVYATTAHELGHLAHWHMGKNHFFRVAAHGWKLPSSNIREPQFAAIIESWAKGVAWRFAHERYKNKFNISNYKYSSDYQNQSIANYPIYTTLVVDLIDSNNQRSTNGNVIYPQDNVSGFTIKQIEQGLKGAYYWNDWRNNMKTIDSSQKNEIDELFANWY